MQKIAVWILWLFLIPGVAHSSDVLCETFTELQKEPLNSKALQELRNLGEKGESQLWKYYQRGLVYTQFDLETDIPLMEKRAESGDKDAQAAYIVSFAILPEANRTFYRKYLDSFTTFSEATAREYWRGLESGLKNNKNCGLSNFLLGIGALFDLGEHKFISISYKNGPLTKSLKLFKRAAILGFDLALLFVAQVNEKLHKNSIDNLFLDSAKTGNLWARYQRYLRLSKEDAGTALSWLNEDEFPLTSSIEGNRLIELKEDVKGIKLLLTSIKHGDIFGNYVLGKYLKDHLEEDIDGVQSLETYLLYGALRNHLQSMIVLGNYYVSNSQIEEGVKWITKASDLKHDQSTRWLAQYYRDNNRFNLAYDFYLKIVEKSAEDFFQLALFNRDKKVNFPDDEKFICFMKSAADLGHNEAYYYRICYNKGEKDGYRKGYKDGYKYAKNGTDSSGEE